MKIEIAYGTETYPVTLDEARMDLRLAQAEDPKGDKSWAEVVAAALDRPIGTQPLEERDLHDKQIVVITDDWGRPTPAAEVVPLILARLEEAGAEAGAITFVTASGMHDPMSRDELARKLGAEVVDRYRCVSHDGGDWTMLHFVGVSALGTPVWVNRYVAEADLVVGLGRVFPHSTHGYEGGYKLILPGVAGFDTILRDHSFNFSPESVPGTYENPSRLETDAVGRMVGIDFLINVVVNRDDAPIRAFAGAVTPVHEKAIAYGDHRVWGAPVGHYVDISLVGQGEAPVPAEGFDSESVRRVCEVTKPEGTVVVVGKAPFRAMPDWADGERADDEALEQLSREAFGPQLRSLAFSELMRLHERRDWPLPPREIQWRAKAIRGEFYRRRWMMAAGDRRIVFTRDPQTALEAALARHGGRPRVLVVPDGRATLPKLALSTVER